MNRVMSYSAELGGLRNIPVSDRVQVEEIIETQGYNLVNIYSNIPEGQLEDAAASTAITKGFRHILVASLHFFPRLLSRVLERDLEPYAIFAR